MRARSSAWTWVGVLGVLAAGSALSTAGCGAKFELPTEHKGKIIPGDGTYQMIASWSGFTGVRDVMLTQGAGTQLFVLFNPGTGTGPSTTPRGAILEFPLVRPVPITGQAGHNPFNQLFNPIALASGNNRIFVLDAGDTCIARTNPISQKCDSTGGWDNRITDLSSYWRVREYGILGGDTISTFTDTTLSSVSGIAADPQGNVYVGGVAIIVQISQIDPRLRYRLNQFRIYKYARGPKYPGQGDPNMPGSAWHRDTTFVIEEGTGVGSVIDPRGMEWAGVNGNALYAADHGKNWIQKLYDTGSNNGYFQLDGGQTGATFLGPTDVAVDRQGFIYALDHDNQRVLRYDSDGNYIQRVDIERDTRGLPLNDPIAIAADDSTVYVADRINAEVVRYKRRQ
jgi:hypothetical protein